MAHKLKRLSPADRVNINRALEQNHEAWKDLSRAELLARVQRSTRVELEQGQLMRIVSTFTEATKLVYPALPDIGAGGPVAALYVRANAVTLRLEMFEARVAELENTVERILKEIKKGPAEHQLPL